MQGPERNPGGWMNSLVSWEEAERENTVGGIIAIVLATNEQLVD